MNCIQKTGGTEKREDLVRIWVSKTKEFVNYSSSIKKKKFV